MSGPASLPDFGSCKAAIIAAFPELARATFTAIDAGWDSLAVDVDDCLIFKFPRDGEAESALKREAALLAALRPHLSLPVPDMHIVEGTPLFSTHANLPGEHLLSADYARLDDKSRDALAKKIARFHAEMHALSVLSTAAVGETPIEPWQPASLMREAGLPSLPVAIRDQGAADITAYEALSPDPLGTIFGYFDAHGWNMAFDHERGVLNGLFDFADSGIGPLHQEFIYANFISRDHSARVIAEYEALTGRTIDQHRVDILTSMLHLSDLAEYADDPDTLRKVLDYAIPWFESRQHG